jgi:hypothetical protein
MLRHCCTAVAPLLRHCCTAVQLLHICCTAVAPLAVAPLLHHCCTTVVPSCTAVAQLLHLCRATVAPLSRHCCTSVAPLLHRCCTSVAPLLHRCSAVAPLMHRCCTSVALLLHLCCAAVATAVAQQRPNLVSLFRVVSLCSPISHCHFRGVCILPGRQIPDGCKHSQFNWNYVQSTPPHPPSRCGSAGPPLRGSRRVASRVADHRRRSRPDGPGRWPETGPGRAGGWARRLHPRRTCLGDRRTVRRTSGPAPDGPGRR